MALARLSDEPLAFYVFAKVLGDIANAWEGRALDVERAHAVRDTIVPPARRLLNQLATGMGVTASDADELVRAYLSIDLSVTR